MGYSRFTAARCWVHLLRAIHELRGVHSEDADLADWAMAIPDLYQKAKQVAASDAGCPERVAGTQIS